PAVAVLSSDVVLSAFSAIAPSPLTVDRIKVPYSGNPTFGLQVHVIAVAGVDPFSIFDHDPSIPATEPCATITQYGIQYDLCSLSIQTSGVDFVIAIVSINDAGSCTAPSDFNQIVAGGRLGFDYQIASTPGDVVYDCSDTACM